MAGASRVVLAQGALIAVHGTARFVGRRHRFEMADWPQVLQAGWARKHTGLVNCTGAMCLHVVACTVDIAIQAHSSRNPAARVEAAAGAARFGTSALATRVDGLIDLCKRVFECHVFMWARV